MLTYLLLAQIIFIFLLIPRYVEPVVIEDLVTDEECDHILAQAEKKFKPSTVAQNKILDQKTRQSDTAWLDPRTDPVIKRVMSKCLKYVDRPIQNVEMLSVLKYTPGGFYKPHQDAFEGDKNHRMYTFIIGLNDESEYEGGSTHFPRLDKTYRLGKGDVLFFHNLDNYELVCGKSLHCGEPVTKGTKYIANVWVRKYPY